VFLGAFRAEFSVAPDEVEIAGPGWAFERGAYKITLSPKAGGDRIPAAGKYITVYQRQQNGSGAMARDIWNSDNPLSGTPRICNSRVLRRLRFRT
jgi:ketosteroid isomerase-like protein